MMNAMPMGSHMNQMPTPMMNPMMGMGMNPMPGQSAAGGREGSERAPAIGGGIVDFHRREIPSLTPADHKQLSAGGDSGEMLARSGHRGQRVPLIRERIVDREQTSVRRSPDGVDPAVDDRRRERAAR